MSIRRSILFSSFSQYLLKVIGFANVIVMARLLSPDELGIYAIAGSVVIIVSELKLMGTTSYLVREKDISREKVQSGIGLSMIFSWGLGILLVASSGWLALFFEIPELAVLFKILALNFIFAPFTSVTNSLLSRELKFEKILIVNVATEVTRFAASIAFVLYGLSYIGLAWGILVGSLVEFCLLAKMRPALASWRPSFVGLKPIFSFGIYSSLTNLLARFDANTPDLIIGKMGSSAQVAYFSRGVGFLTFLTQLITSGIWPVVLPYLSQVNRDGGNIKDAYTKASLLLGGLCWPVLAVAGMLSYPIILLLFGEQWTESVPLVSILTIWGIFRIIHCLSPQLLITMHRERLMLGKQVCLFTATVGLVYLAFPYGLIMVAWAMALVGILDFIISSIVVYLTINLSMFRFICAMWKNILLVLTCMTTTYCVGLYVDYSTETPIISLLLVGPCVAVTWLVTLYLVKHPLLTEIMGLLKPLITKRV
ncbi:MAG: O-antigen/teichoic acid export membrane protein [Paraglaciecola sp.]|jgi:O-antigen/teichoic acid export membrane protein